MIGTANAFETVDTFLRSQDVQDSGTMRFKMQKRYAKVKGSNEIVETNKIASEMNILNHQLRRKSEGLSHILEKDHPMLEMWQIFGNYTVAMSDI